MSSSRSGGSSSDTGLPSESSKGGPSDADEESEASVVTEESVVIVESNPGRIVRIICLCCPGDPRLNTENRSSE